MAPRPSPLPNLRTSLAILTEEARLAVHALAEFADHLVHPTVRVGVTGLRHPRIGGYPLTTLS